jgi:hypothetical protein
MDDLAAARAWLDQELASYLSYDPRRARLAMFLEAFDAQAARNVAVEQALAEGRRALEGICQVINDEVDDVAVERSYRLAEAALAEMAAGAVEEGRQ